jgi:hypothetical protein
MMALSKIDSDGIVSGGITADSLNIGQIGGRRNLIINGAMQVAQRGTSFTGLTNGSSQYTVDRFKWGEGGTPTFVNTVTKDTDAPDGFSSSLKVLVTTAQGSLGASDQLRVDYLPEAQDLQMLNYGSANAQSFTLSFYVKSNKTGTYNIRVRQPDASAREYSQAYTVDSADTWERKTITWTGDASGQIDNDNGVGLQIFWFLAAGSNFTSGTAPTDWIADDNTRAAVGQVNLADTLNNYWQITGAQLEVGSVATPFEHRSYGESLAACQRYYQSSYNTGVSPGSSVDEFAGNNGGQGVYHAFGTNVSGGVASSIGSFVTQMRTRPTVTVYDHSGNSGKITTFDSGSSSTANQSYNAVRQSQRQVIVRTYQSSIFGFEYLYEADAEL